MSDVKPKLGQLAQRLNELTWAGVKLMTVQLGVAFSTLRQIEERDTEISNRLLSAMDTWLNSDTAASWAKVIEALIDIDKNVLAEKLKKEFCSPQTPPAETDLAATTTQPASCPAPSSPPPAAGDVTLSQSDAMDITEELIEVQNHTHFLGLKLKLPNHVVDGIQSQYPAPKDRLYHVIDEFLKQVDPEPTWRAIVEALKSPAIGLPRLAKEIERRHCLVSPVQSPSKTCNTATQHASPQQPPSTSSHSLCTPPQQQTANGASRSDVLLQTPCLSHLYTLPSRTQGGCPIKIIQRIGSRYSEFGTLLLNDDKGDIVSAKETEHRCNVDAINRDILTKWLQGHGRAPRNWATLIAVLREMGLDLAQDIENNL